MYMFFAWPLLMLFQHTKLAISIDEKDSTNLFLPAVTLAHDLYLI